MDGLRGACGRGGRQCSGPFWRRGVISRSCGAHARLADRHFTSCGGGGGSRGDGFLQATQIWPAGEGAHQVCDQAKSRNYLRAELCAPKYVCGQSAKKGTYLDFYV
ncbi:uncharacterized protein LOC144379052 [Halichoerus grypus]